MLFDFIKTLSSIIAILIAMAYLTLAERKVLASIQLREGPNVVGPYGLLQPFADALKLFTKELIVPIKANYFIWLFIPILGLFLALLTWGPISIQKGHPFSHINLGILYILAISSLSVYSVLFAGWTSNSRYALLGSLRSTAQMISYEVTIGLQILTVAFCVGSLEISSIIHFQKDIPLFIPLWVSWLMFYVSSLAETNRTPFDLPEGESELVSGYNVEYSSMPFALFFLAEYVHIIFAATLMTILFFGGWDFFLLKVLLHVFIIIWIRGTLPRYRYDQLMTLIWKVLLPLSLAQFVLISSLLIWK